MGKMNLLKANWIGKVGETVGAKWKNKKTIRTYSIPANPKTDAQMSVRGVFANLTSFVALFSDQIKYLTSLDVRGMSVRNAIIKANKAQIGAGTFDPETLIVNKGGLPTVSGLTVATWGTTGNITATWTKPTATNLSEKARMVVVMVDKTANVAVAADALLSAETINVPMQGTSGNKIDCYYYIIDYRGSSRVGSISQYTSGTPA